MTGRAKIGFGEALSDLGAFTTTEAPVRPSSATRLAAAEAAGFVSREVAGSAALPAPQGQRRHRTGRSAQLNLKARPETIAAFQSWSERKGLSLAEAFEELVGSLEGIT